ncbi:MAG TPA: peptidoglycan DD-metalloendopeptidase family protein [Conexibacter sp.]|jgi:murein DD-endopeptidase MepM/ murein hydrolase activator NlpD|nr:peptidoglycan DD-metalloendopeptidase family protein [Conexibacter sp.]
MRLRSVLLIAVLAPLALWVALPLASSASPQASVSSLQSRIDRKRGQLDQMNGRARVLSSDISGLTHRIDALQSTITTLQQRQNTIQADLDAKRAELVRTQRELRGVRARLVQLRARLEQARAVLANRLVELYKSDQPDIVSVVLDAHGFADLLDNGAYLQRIGQQDRAIIVAVRDAKAEMATAARRLGTLEQRQQQITTQIYERRNAVARVRLTVQGKRDAIDQVRNQKQGLLGSVRAHATKIDEDLKALQAQQSKIESEIRSAQGGGNSLPAGPIRGGGRFIWPVNGPITSPFCERRAWEACHPGIDIGVPSGTPIRAAGSGNVVIAGWVSGYGNYTCIDHGGGISTCYGHQSSLQVSVGQRVMQGQVIGLSGCTGLCFGDHLHFEVRINGSVTNPVNYLG